MHTLARWIAAAALLCGLCGPLQAQIGGFGGFGQASRMMLNVGGPNSQATGEIGIRPWATVSGNYSVTYNPQADGSRLRTSGYGAFAGYGASGGRSWYRTSLGVNFAGMYRPKMGTIRRSLSSHVLSIGVSHLAGRRTRASAAAFGGYSNGGMGFGGASLGSGMLLPFGMGNIMQMGAVDFGNPNENAIVDEEVFDVGTLFTGASGGLIHQLSQRWAIGAGGGAFMARRRYRGLAQSQGTSAYALGSYAIDRTSSIGVQFAQSWFSYKNLFGGNQAQALSLFYQKAITPRLFMGLSAGAFRLRATFIGVVDVDPAFREFLGGFRSFEVRRGTRDGVMGTAFLTRSFRYGSMSATYFRGLTPGNGILLASRRDRASLTASTGLPGRFGLGGVVSYGESRALQQEGLRSRNLTYAASVGRNFAAGFGFGLSAGYRTFKFNNGPTVSGQFVSAGLQWAPPDALLVF